MAYIRKTRDEYNIMGNYGYSWEYECAYDTLKEAKQGLREYRENGNGLYKLEKKRIKLS